MCSERSKKYREANKEAIAEKHKKYREANKEKEAERGKKYREANKEKEVERHKKYREANKEAIAEYHKQHNKVNKEANAEKAKQYYQANKGVILEKTSQYKKERYNSDPLFRLTCNMRNLIRQSLINGGYTKKSQTHEILGCSYDEYHQHIESQFTDGMSWERMSEIHIDHRLPVSAATTEAEMLALNHHRNLQPLWKSDNLAKGSSYCPKELAAYLAKYK